MKTLKNRQRGYSGYAADYMTKELHSRMFPEINQLKAEPIIYTMGVDTEDPSANAYCLGYWQTGVFNVLISKYEPESIEFTEEIKNIGKYFNATIYTEK